MSNKDLFFDPISRSNPKWSYFESPQSILTFQLGVHNTLPSNVKFWGLFFLYDNYSWRIFETRSFWNSHNFSTSPLLSLSLSRSLTTHFKNKDNLNWCEQNTAGHCALWTFYKKIYTLCHTRYAIYWFDDFDTLFS